MLFFKTKTITDDKWDDDRFDLVPPETHYLSSSYMVRIPVTDKHLRDRWELRKHAAKLVERSIGDEVQITSFKVKKPHMVRKSVARLRGQVPYARAYVTIKF
jgi:hypothetical protein